MSSSPSQPEDPRKYPKYNVVSRPDGGTYVLTSCVSQQTFDSGLSYQPVSSDVFVATYPKNGTTWMIHIINMLINGVDTSATTPTDSLDNYYTFVEFNGAEAVRAKPSPRIVKTHLPFELCPYKEAAKYVFIARNPKDCLVSFFHHTVGFNQYYDYADGKFDDFCELFLRGGTDFDDYFKTVPEWHKQSKVKENICFFLYEDMKADLKTEVMRLAKFLGAEYVSRLSNNNGKLLQEIMQRASIGQMKKHSTAFMKSERPAELPFIRKGVVGDWRTMLSEAQSDQINEKLTQTGISYPGFDQLWKAYEELVF